jgi:hypothetical protein
MERGHECYHCKQWVAAGETHDCWSTTESALTRDLHEDLQDAYDRLRETATELGDQRIYASHHSIMFARRACYFFVRPKRAWLEVCIFLDRALKEPQVRRAESASRTRVANMLRVTHRDEVEAPITDWLREAYGLVGESEAKAKGPAKSAAAATQPALPPRARGAKKR